MPFDRGLEGNADNPEGGFRRKGVPTRYFKWDPGEELHLRLLNEEDDVIIAPVHEYVKTFDGGRKSFVCRKSVGEPCPLCEVMDREKDLDPDEKTVKLRKIGLALAVKRAPDPKNVGKFVDVTEEVTLEEEGGKEVTKKAPWVGILQQSMTFWGFYRSAAKRFGTITNRDWSITRRGEKKKTAYDHFPNDPDPINNLGERYAKWVVDIEQILTNMASENYYNRNLYGKEPEGSSEEAPKSKSASNGSKTKLDDKEFNELRAMNAALADEEAVEVYE